MTGAIDFEKLVQVAGDAIIAVDTEGKIQLWTTAAVRIFGHESEDAVGQSLNLIIPERFRQRHWQGFHAVIESGHSKYGADVLRVPALHKDGRTLSIAFTVALLSSGSGVSTIVAIVRDETSRWQEEQELRRGLAELEKELAKSR